MTARNKQQNSLAAYPTGAQPPRMRAPLRKAIDLIAIKGKQVGQAAEAVGMNPCALSRAINRPEIKAYIEAVKAQYCLDADALQGLARAIAIKTGIELMTDTKSEAIKARMVEFFARNPTGPVVNVQVNNAPTGYSYARPSPQTIDAKAIPDPDDNM